MCTSWWLRGGRIVDPATDRDEVGDLLIQDGIISEPRAPCDTVPEIDARGLVVAPGLLDMHVHFRQPGNTDAETIATGSAAAAHGGFSCVITMPNTTPPIDTADRVRHSIQLAGDAGLVRLLPAGCITAARAGEEVADLSAMAEAGAVAFTDDGSTVSDEALLSAAMRRAAAIHRPILDHALDPALAGDGVMHEGKTSARLGLRGIPAQAEVAAVERDIRLARETGCRVHIQHLSAAPSVAMIEEAKRKGLPLSAEATPHHLALTDNDIRPDSTNLKMNPPLGSRCDREAILQAVCDGSIEVLATDHAPHTARDKDRGFSAAPFGVVGLETAVGVTYSLLVKPGLMDLPAWLARWSTGPAHVLGLPPPGLAPGQAADVTVLDLRTEWTVASRCFHSKSVNTPFEGQRLTGRAAYTFYAGKLTWDSRNRVDTGVRLCKECGRG